jgi:N-acyl-D-amino-acid deacylase
MNEPTPQHDAAVGDRAERIVIKGGIIVDGTGAPGVVGDLAIEGDRIVAVGGSLTGDVVLDATGCIVAPGFIDIHTHYDAQVFWDPALTPSCFHGVTSVVAGNCGFSIAPVRPDHHELMAATMEKVEDMEPATLLEGVPWDFETFPQYLAQVQQSGSVLNFGAYIGHTALRFHAMGAGNTGRVATDEEIATMVDAVGAAMDAGAVGFATSFAATHRGADGNPIPSRYADRREVDALASVIVDKGRGVIGVNGGEGLSFSDCYDLSDELGVRVTYTAVLTTPTGAHLKAASIHGDRIAQGSQVWPQISCRPLAFSMHLVEPFTLNTNPVFAELMPVSLDDRRRAYESSEWRERAKEAWRKDSRLPARWETFWIMESTTNPSLIGSCVQTMADEQGVHPLDVLLDLVLAEPTLMSLRVKATVANDDPDGIAVLLKQPHMTLGLSDAGAHVGQICDAPLSTDLLGNWVRERQELTIEDAVHRLTGVQAALFGFEDRGVLRPGAFADVCVFDPATVSPGPIRRIRDFPANGERLTADAPVGVKHVLVNGVIIRRDEQPLDVDAIGRPGRLLVPSS